MGKLNLRLLGIVGMFCALATIGLSADTFTTLVSFTGTNGSIPLYGTLIQGLNGNFYGTTEEGGAGGRGAVFEINPGGTLTTLYSFGSTLNDGGNPLAGLVLATNGNFYGTTYNYGANGYGTVFKITPGGKSTTLYNFCSQSGCTDGHSAYGALIQATNGNFYGTTYSGGASGYGTVFKITQSGALTTLHSFDYTDGANPYAGLVQASNGNFYGTAFNGGANGQGTIFELTPGGKLTTLYNFCSQSGCTDGADPTAELVQATNGNLYGTTLYSGANLYGTVFEITPAGKLTTLHSFGGTDGANPYARLVQATDGNFYGTTFNGGANSNGTVFEITPAGTLTTLYSFCSQTNCTDGQTPQAGLIQATNGTFYGTTPYGGANNVGTIFSLVTGLGPFVGTLPPSGTVGAAVKILGNKLTGATSVTFNRAPATFTVVSSTEITTTVPSGATTGKLKVITPSGTLTSNINFRVTPTITSFLPTSGTVGTSVAITGQSFTGATKVTFGGVKATSFTINSDTKITATVPTGAKTGKIAVTTPGGTASSSGTFTVTA